MTPRIGRPRGALGRHPYGALTRQILFIFDGREARTLKEIAEKVSTSRQMVHQALLRWRPKEYRQWPGSQRS